MSEDFLLAICPDHSSIFETIEEAKESILSGFKKMVKENKLNEDDLDLICTGYVDHNHPELLRYPLEESDFLAALEDSLEYLWEHPNDMASWVDSAGLPLWVTGGMSGGDSPTESFDHIVRIALVAEPVDAPIGSVVRRNATTLGKQMTI